MMPDINHKKADPVYPEAPFDERDISLARSSLSIATEIMMVIMVECDTEKSGEKFHRLGLERLRQKIR